MCLQETKLSSVIDQVLRSTGRPGYKIGRCLRQKVAWWNTQFWSKLNDFVGVHSLSVILKDTTLEMVWAISNVYGANSASE